MAAIELSEKTVLVTGAAGFIGAALSNRLMDEGAKVVGMDNLNDYYDVSLKRRRLNRLEAREGFRFEEASIADRDALERIWARFRPQVTVNLAAQAGVRYSIDHPEAYIESNVVGFFNVLEACRRFGTQHLVYASSSSVYGANAKTPYSTQDKTDSPVSLYAATKKADELMAHAYSKLYDIPATGLRFFTVYGPEGRPDMAYFGFAEKLRRGETIRIFNYGRCQRDFTYIDDIVEGVARVIRRAPDRRLGEDGLPVAPCAVYNIGGSQPENLMTFVRILAEELQRAGALPKDFDLNAHCEMAPMQPGDVVATCADASELERDFGFRPSTPLRAGLRRFAEWYCEYVNAKE